MAEKEPKVICRTPTPGKNPTRIPTWKYELVRDAILSALPEDGGSMAFKDLSKYIGSRLSREERFRLGSVGWHTTTVKLDMEVKGEIERVPGSNPQHLRRTGVA